MPRVESQQLVCGRKPYISIAGECMNPEDFNTSQVVEGRVQAVCVKYPKESELKKTQEG
jgi:hypothetical protein